MDIRNPLQLGNAEIDNDHNNFAELVNRMLVADNPTFAVLFGELVEHTIEHFDRENQLMAEHGYPAQAEHRGEHSRVLGELAQFKKRVDAGRLTFGRAYVQEQLPRWFELHVTTMDSALTEFIKRQQSAEA